MSTLYELTGQMQALLALMEDPDTDPEIIEDSFEAVSGERDAKLDGYGRVRAQMKADIAAMKAEEDRMANRRKAMENNVKRLESHVQDSMIATGDTKVKTTLFTFSIQKNPPRVVIDDPDRIPEGFLIPQPPKVDMARLKTELKEADLPESEDLSGIAHLEQGESLIIR